MSGEGGVRVGGGRLRVDAARAVTKLRNYQLPDPTLWTLEVVRAAVLLGATAIHVEADADDVWIGWEGPPLPTVDLTRLFDDLVGGGRERRGHRLLAVGVNTALALSPRFCDVWSIDPGTSHRARYGTHLLRASEDGRSDALRSLVAEEVARPEALLAIARGNAVHVRRAAGLDVMRRALTGDVPPEVHRVIGAANALTIPLFAQPRPTPARPPLLRIPIGGGSRSHLRGHADVIAPSLAQGPAQLVWSELGVMLCVSPLGPPRLGERVPVVIQLDYPTLPTNAARSAVREGEPLIEDGLREARLILGEVIAALAAEIERTAASGDAGRHHELRAAAIAIVHAMSPSGPTWMEAVKAAQEDAIHRPLLDVPVTRNALGAPRTLRQIAEAGLDVAHRGVAPVRAELAPWLAGVPWAPPGDPLCQLYGESGPKNAAPLVAHAERRAAARLRYLARPEVELSFPMDGDALASATFGATSVLDVEHTWLPDDALDVPGLSGRVVIESAEGRAPRGQIVLVALRRALERVDVPSEVPFRAVLTATSVLPDAAHIGLADRDVLDGLVRAVSWAAVAAAERLAGALTGMRDMPHLARHGGLLETAIGPAAQQLPARALEATVRAAQRMALRLAAEAGRGTAAIDTMISRPTALSAAPAFRPWPDGAPLSLLELRTTAQTSGVIGTAAPSSAREATGPAGRLVIELEQGAEAALATLLSASTAEPPKRSRGKAGKRAAPRSVPVHVVPYGELPRRVGGPPQALLNVLRAPEVALFHEAPGLRAVVALERHFAVARAHLFHAGRPIAGERPLRDAHVPLVLVADDDQLVPTPDWTQLAEPRRHAPELFDVAGWCRRLAVAIADHLLGQKVPGLLTMEAWPAFLFIRLAALVPDGARSEPALSERLHALREVPVLRRLGGELISVGQLLLAGAGSLPYVGPEAIGGLSGPVPPELSAAVLAQHEAVAIARFFEVQAVDRTEALTAWREARRRARAWESFLQRPEVPDLDLGPEAATVSGAQIERGAARAAERHRAHLRITTHGRLVEALFGESVGLAVEAHVDVAPDLVELDPIALNEAGRSRVKGALRDAARRLLTQTLERSPTTLASDPAIASLALAFVGEMPSRKSGPTAQLIGAMLDAPAFPVVSGGLGSLRSMVREGDELWAAEGLTSWWPPTAGARPHALDRAPLLSLPSPSPSGEPTTLPWVALARLLARQLGTLRDVTKEARRLVEARNVARGADGVVSLPGWVPRTFAVPLATLAERSSEGDVLTEVFPQGEAALAAQEASRLVLVGSRGETVLTYPFVPPVMIAARSPYQADIDEPEARQRVEAAVRTVVAETLRWTIDVVPHETWPPEIKRAVRSAALLGGRTHLERIATAAVFATTTGRYVSYDVLREQVNRFGELWVVTSTDVTLAPLDPLRLAVVVAAHERAPLNELLPTVQGERELALDEEARRNLARPAVASIGPTSEEQQMALGAARIEVEGGEAWVMPLAPRWAASRGMGVFIDKKPLGAVDDPCRWPTRARIDSSALRPDRVHGAPQDDAALERIAAQVRAASESILADAVAALHARTAPLDAGQPRHDVDDDVSFSTFGAGSIEVRGRLTLTPFGEAPSVQVTDTSGHREMSLTATAPKSLLPAPVPLSGMLVSSAFDLSTVPATQLDALARRAYVALLGACAKRWQDAQLPAEARELALAHLVRGAIDRHLSSVSGKWQSLPLPMLRGAAESLKDLSAAVLQNAAFFSLAPNELGALGGLAKSAVVVVRDGSLPSRALHALLGDRMQSLRDLVLEEPSIERASGAPAPAPPKSGKKKTERASAAPPPPAPPDPARVLVQKVAALVRAAAGSGPSVRLEPRRGEPIVRFEGSVVGIAERYPLVRELSAAPAVWTEAAVLIAAEAASRDDVDEPTQMATLLRAWAEA